MGSSASYREYGNTYDSTYISKDKENLQKINCKPRKITHLRFFYDKTFIVGIETYYDGVSAGANLGIEFKEADYFDFILGPNEFITNISGTA